MKELLCLSIENLRSQKIVDWAYTTDSKPLTKKEYQKWVSHNLHGPLRYMADHRKDMRFDLKNFFPEFKSAIVFLFDYTSSAKRNSQQSDYRFAAYTQGFDGIDYHHWIKSKLEKIATSLGLKNYKLSIDTQPVLERDLAYRSGLGWFGKNSMLINRKHGSFFLISSILLDHELELASSPIEVDHCGSCTRCIDACPTQAIVDNKVIDASKCISTFTIEVFKDVAAPEGFPTERGEVFGCDICQEVCPWNRKPLFNSEEQETPKFIKDFENTNLKQISNREFKKIFKGTSLERTGRVGLLKNFKKKI